MRYLNYIFLFCLIINSISLNSFAQEIGRYGLFGGDYRYYALNRAIQNQRINAQIRQRQINYYSNPTRNIKYPTSYNRYPNIQRSNYDNISARQRYSPIYYEHAYR